MLFRCVILCNPVIDITQFNYFNQVNNNGKELMKLKRLFVRHCIPLTRGGRHFVGVGMVQFRLLAISAFS